MNLEKLDARRRKKISEINDVILIPILKRLTQLIPVVKSQVNGLEGIRVGMGTWSFMGKTTAWDSEEMEEVEFDLESFIEYYLDETVTNDLELDVTDEMVELYNLLNYIVGELNASTDFDEVIGDTVVFYRDAPGYTYYNGPFGSGSIEYFKQSYLHQLLVKRGVKFEIRPTPEITH